MKQRKEFRYKSDLEKFENSVFTRFKLNKISSLKDEAVKLYEQEVSIEFKNFYTKFQNWLIDWTQEHTDLIQSEKFLTECKLEYENSLKEVDSILEYTLDSNGIFSINNSILKKSNEYSEIMVKRYKKEIKMSNFYFIY